MKNQGHSLQGRNDTKGTHVTIQELGEAGAAPPAFPRPAAPTLSDLRKPWWKKKKFVAPAVVVGSLLVLATVAPQADEQAQLDTPEPTLAADVAPIESPSNTVAPSVAPQPAVATTVVPPPPTTAPAPPTIAAAPIPPVDTAAVGVAVAITNVVDGDTVDLADGSRVRVLGYDTPERGQCGYDEATASLRYLLTTGVVTISTDNGDNVDKYGRLLRHVLVDGNPVGGALIAAGMADARYDSLDGYPRHRYQDEYRAADGPNTFTCATAAVAEPVPGAAPQALPAERPSEVPTGGADLDCADIGRKVWVGSNDYHRLDRDGDGWGCESYG